MKYFEENNFAAKSNPYSCQVATFDKTKRSGRLDQWKMRSVPIRILKRIEKTQLLIW